VTTIILISGSLRRESLNSTAIATVRSLLTRRDASVRTRALDLRVLPHYDQDVEAVDGSPPVAAAKRLVSSADAVVISTPSYNGSAPGVLKNALDWLSRPWGDSALTGKPVAVMSASPGQRGAADAQAGLRVNLERSGAVLIDHPPLALSRAGSLSRSEGEFTDASVLAQLDVLAGAVLDACRTSSEPSGLPQSVGA
jgi:chromate reductase